MSHDWTVHIVNDHLERFGNIIEHPALVIDKDDNGTLLFCGNKRSAELKFETIIRRYAAAGFHSLTSSICLIELDNRSLTLEQQCYILRRCIEYTGDGFHRQLCERLLNPDQTGETVLEWLQAEMARVPIKN